MADHRKKLIEIFVRGLSRGSYTDYLGIRSQPFAPVIGDTHTEFSFRIPPHICFPVKGNPCLSVSAAMALFDEYSSMCLMMTDRSARGGVSIVLSAELHKFCPANTNVTVVTTATKIGKTIGFCDIEMFDQDRELVAHGSHVKFIDMGWAWNFLMHPSRIGNTMAAYEAIGDKLHESSVGNKLMSLLGKGGRLSSVSPPFEEPGRAFEEFGLQPVLGGDNEAVQAQLHVKPFMGNYFGNLHGGAAAMVAEKCATESSADFFRRGARITSMEMKYLSPMTNDLVVSTRKPLAVDHSGSNGEKSMWPLLSHGEITKLGRGGADVAEKSTVCAQYKCHWGSL